MLIGVCGGIGSGKSVVSRILRLKGFEVYDCDSEAKRLMAADSEIKCRIRDLISSEVTDGVAVPDRELLAKIVFSDEAARLKLNEIVHEAVRNDIAKKAAEEKLMWVESAIIAESGLAAMCDRIWKVESPESLRIKRAIERDLCSKEDIERRIESQSKEESLLEMYEEKIDKIINDENHSLLDQINGLLNKL